LNHKGITISVHLLRGRWDDNRIFFAHFDLTLIIVKGAFVTSGTFDNDGEIRVGGGSINNIMIDNKFTSIVFENFLIYTTKHCSVELFNPNTDERFETIIRTIKVFVP